MIGDEIKYTCKKCGWQTSIRKEWADLKPKRCMNKKCNTNFLAEPASLLIDRPVEKKEAKKPASKKKVTKKKRVYRKKKR